MQYLSDHHPSYDEYGFRTSHIFPILEKYGISLSSEDAKREEPLPSQEPYPEWAINLAKRNRLSVFEAACTLAGVDPFSDFETFERFGINEVAYERGRALLDEAIDDGLVKAFKKVNGNHTQTFVNARDFAAWCDSINLARPLPWDFDKTVPAIDASSQHELTELRQELAKANEKLLSLERRNYDLTTELLELETKNGISNEEAMSKLRAENDQLRAELSSQKPALDSGLSFRYETEMLRRVSEVQARYLGDNYDHNDLDTSPRKDDVVEWLRKQDKDLSKVSAEAIDRIAMPFNRAK